MTFWEVLTGIVAIWAMGFVTWFTIVDKDDKKAKEQEEETEQMRRDCIAAFEEIDGIKKNIAANDNEFYKHVQRQDALYVDIRKDIEALRKATEEAKKFITQASLATAFVPRSKREQAIGN